MNFSNISTLEKGGGFGPARPGGARPEGAHPEGVRPEGAHPEGVHPAGCTRRVHLRVHTLKKHVFLQ